MRMTDGEYHALSQLRYLIRKFLQEGDETARAGGAGASTIPDASGDPRATFAGGSEHPNVGGAALPEAPQHG